MDYQQSPSCFSEAFLTDSKQYIQQIKLSTQEINRTSDAYKLGQEFLVKYGEYMKLFPPYYSHICEHYVLLEIEPEEEAKDSTDEKADLLSQVYSHMAFAHYSAVQYNKLMENEDEPMNYEPGLELATISLQYSPNNEWALYSYAVIVGMMAETNSSIKQRVLLGKYYHTATMKLIKYHPSQKDGYHLLGRFQFHIAKLSWLEKKIARTVFGELPEANWADVEATLLKSENCRPNWPSNHLFLAKCLISQKRVDEAARWVNMGLEYKPDHPSTQIDANELKEIKRKYKF